MTDHLTRKIRHLERRAELKPGDAVLDIGSNDCTSLKAYATSSLVRVGIDPTGAEFKSFYPDDVILVPDFFSAANYRKATGRQAKIVTSIAMFYDLGRKVVDTFRSRMAFKVMAAHHLWRLHAAELNGWCMRALSTCDPPAIIRMSEIACSQRQAEKRQWR